MRLDWSRGADALALLAEMLPGADRGFENGRGVAVVDGMGRTAAGLALHDWSPEAGTIEISAAAVDPRWLTRGVASDLFGYCFAFCQAVVTRTTEDNARVRKIWRSLGADEHVLPNAAGRGRALVIFVLTDAAWAASKWRQAIGQAKISRAA